jgi:ribosome maturation factor RimP
MYKQNKQLLVLIEPVVSAMGYELLGIEHLKQGRYSLLRLYIDNEQGITLSDCERVSHQVTGLLDVEDPIKGTYKLEVSSPGLDRPLFTLEQFVRHQGEDVKLNLVTKIEGRRKLQGRISEVSNEHVLIESDGIEYKVPVDAIQQAHIVAKLKDYDVLNKREH